MFSFTAREKSQRINYLNFTWGLISRTIPLPMKITLASCISCSLVDFDSNFPSSSLVKLKINHFDHFSSPYMTSSCFLWIINLCPQTEGLSSAKFFHGYFCTFIILSSAVAFISVQLSILCKSNTFTDIYSFDSFQTEHSFMY